MRTLERSTVPDRPRRVAGPDTTPHGSLPAPAATELAASIEAAGARLRPGSGGPDVLPPETILRLQRIAGNRGVTALLDSVRAQGWRAASRRALRSPGRGRGQRVIQRDLMDDIGDAVSDTVHSVSDTASDAANAASDTASDVAGTVAHGAGQAWDATTEGASEVWNTVESGARAVESGAREVVYDVADVASDVAHGVADTAGEAWDTVTEAATNVGSAVSDGLLEAWDETADVANEVVDGVTDVAGEAWDRLSDTARQAASGASEVAGTVWSAVADGATQVWDGIKDVAGSAWDTASDVASGAWDAVTTTASEIVEGVRDLAVDAWNGIKDLAGATWDAVSGALGSLWNSVMGGVARLLEGIAENVPAPGQDVRSRGLNGTERARATVIFGDTIDLDVVVVTRGALLGSDTCRTTASTVSMSEKYFDGSGMDLNADGLETLIHELTHVKQFQEGGLGYIPESLWDQLKSWRKTGKVDSAYDWRPLDAAGVPWDDWHVEPQAEAVQEYNHQLMLRDSTDEAERKKFDAATLALLQKYGAFMRRGPRAPAGSAP